MLYVIELALILSYYFSQVLSIVTAAFSILAPYEFIISCGVFAALCAMGWFFYGFFRKLLLHDWTPVIAHLGLYCTIFIGYGKLETYYAQYGEIASRLLVKTGGMSFLNESFIFAISLSVAFAIPFMKKSAALSKYLQKKYLFWLSLISLYSSFACFGDRLFFREGFQFGTLALYLLGAMWLFPIFLSILYLYEVAATKFDSLRCDAPTPIDIRKTRLILFGIFMGIWIIYLIALNPACIIPDSVHMWDEATSGEKIGYLAFPSIIIIFVRLLTNIIPHPIFVVLVQIGIVSLLMSSFLSTLFKHGVPRKFLYIFAFIWALLPQNGIIVVSLLSNTPYTASLLFLTTVILEIVSAKHIAHWTLFKLALALPLAFTTRNEGFMPTIFVIVFLAIFALCKPIKPKLIIATLAGCVLIALIQGPLYYTLTTRSSEEEPAISAAQHLAIDGIQSVVYFGGNLAPETEAYLESFAPIEYWKSTYAIYKIDLWKWPSSFDSVRAKHTNTLIEHYLKTLVREPFLLIQNRLNNADLMWDIAQPKGMYVQRLSISHDIIEEYDFQLKFPRHENILTTIAKIANSVTIAIPLTDILLYRAGAHIIFSMLFCVYLCAHKMRKYMAAFIPMFGSILALLIAMGWPDFRVVWFIFVISTFVAPYLLSCKKHG